jgi:hypothetical protein
MNEEMLLRDLAQLTREHDEALSQLEAACAGTADALRPGPVPEMLRPLGGEFRLHMVERLAQELRADGADAAAQQRRGVGSSLVQHFNALLSRLMAPLRALGHWPAAGLTAAAAAVVLAALGLGIFRAELPGTSAFPAYDLELQGKAYMRGESPPEEGPIVFSAGDRFRLLLRPQAALDGRVAASAFVLAGDSLQPLTAPPARILENGVVMIQGEVGSEVLLPAGDARLLVVVARADALPAGAELRDRLRVRAAADTHDWTAWSIGIQLRP